MSDDLKAAAPLAPGEIIQPTGLTTLHSVQRREVAIRMDCPNRGPLTVVIPQMAAAELIGMLGAELDKLGPLPGETLEGSRNN